MIQPNSTYALIMPKVKLTPIKQRTKNEEVKEIIQNPNDPLSKYPLRAFGYSNEVGAAVSAMPVWGKAAEVALWVPALMYLGADIYDKYRRGKEGNYTKASAAAAVEQATFQALASVILPTAAVKMGQNVVGYLTKFDGSNLNASAKEELYTKLAKDFDKAKFIRGDFVDENGTLIKGIDRAIRKVLNDDYHEQLNSTRSYLKHEKWYSKLVRFFTHSNKPISSAKASEDDVKKFLTEKVREIFDAQTLLENSSFEEIEQKADKRLLSVYKKAVKKLSQNTASFADEDPVWILKKLLNSNRPEYQKFVDEIKKTASTRGDLKTLLSSERESAALLKRLMADANDAKIINNYARKIGYARETLETFISRKTMNLGFLKTAGGFVALGCLAVPIDHFVHKYIIKKFVEPGLENVKNLQSKMSLK